MKSNYLKFKLILTSTLILPDSHPHPLKTKDKKYTSCRGKLLETGLLCIHPSGVFSVGTPALTDEHKMKKKRYSHNAIVNSPATGKDNQRSIFSCHGNSE